MPKVYTPNANFISLAGQRFGKLTATSQIEKRSSKSGAEGRIYYLCNCDCGNVKWVAGCNLRIGHTLSCGCYRTERRKAPKKHGQSRTPEYTAWIRMKHRCYNSAHEEFKHYGGRGITVSDEWIDDFAAFYRDMGARPSSAHSIDRIDNNGSYCKENCKWSTRVEQQRNTSLTIMIEWRGETRSLSEWCELLGLKTRTVRERIKAGWTAERAFTQPLRIIRPYKFKRQIQAGEGDAPLMMKRPL